MSTLSLTMDRAKKVQFWRRGSSFSPSRLPVNPAYVIDRSAAYYPMNHKRRGKALIFTHETFAKSTKLSLRKGAKADSKALVKSLKRLGFDVDIHTDKGKEEINKITDKVSRQDHSNSDCLLVAILTHGGEGDDLCAHDGPYQFSSVWTQFTEERCPSLAGKPKIFVVQACRGDQADPGVMSVEQDGIARYTGPAEADFVFAFATAPGFKAFRSTGSGSWFIQEFCAELNENGERYDLLTLLTFVAQRVAHQHESNFPDIPEIHQKKQIPCVVSKLTRLVLFNERI
uniref:Putative caspase n=1 Tax=Culex tarsalis TaxID=7177 RepID=A0A1Q3FHU7_CULTA